MLVVCLCAAFAVLIVIAVLVLKIYFLKRSAREIMSQFSEKLSADTNTPIGISSSDKDMRGLAAGLNVQLKELRRQKSRYVQGDTELKNAVTNISHDLRTPLTAISSYLDLLEANPDRLGEYLPIIRERTEALAGLTEELFRYSVITSPDNEKPAEMLSVNSVLEECILGYYAPLKERGIEPVIELTEKKIIRNVNRASLARVFANLLNNAMKYSDGDLCISMDDSGLITFSNSSSKLTPVQAERLFDRFYTIENARKSTGLGLSIAKVLIEQMNGTITSSYSDGKLKINIFIQEGEGSGNA